MVGLHACFAVQELVAREPASSVLDRRVTRVDLSRLTGAISPCRPGWQPWGALGRHWCLWVILLCRTREARLVHLYKIWLPKIKMRIFLHDRIQSHQTIQIVKTQTKCAQAPGRRLTARLKNLPTKIRIGSKGRKHVGPAKIANEHISPVVSLSF